METETNKKIAAKLVKVMGECAHVMKRGTNDFHHYSYATSADVMEKVNSALVANKICALAKPELIGLENVTNAKGNMEHLATVKVGITLIDAESGERVEISGMGNGQDAGDKAVMKAETAAIKYAYMLSFAISTGDDPEADTSTDRFMAEQQQQVTPLRPVAKAAARYTSGATCNDCGVKISDKVMQFSTQKFGVSLCMKCQNQHATA